MSRKKKATKESDDSLELNKSLIEKLTPSAPGDKKREISVMSRLSTDLVDVIDMLVKLGIYGSRSEAVAGVLEDALLSQPELTDQLREQVKKIEEIQGKAKRITKQVIRGDDL